MVVKSNNERHVCPVCGKYEFTEYNSFDICDICNWMDDAVQENDHNYEGGANHMSVNQAKVAYKDNIQVR